MDRKSAGGSQIRDEIQYYITVKTQTFQNTSFDIKEEAFDLSYDQLKFLGRSNEWCGMPGYNAMLCAFKCKPLPSSERIGQDPMDWMDVQNEKVSKLLIDFLNYISDFTDL